MNHVRDTYRESHGNHPVISIMDLGDGIVGMLDQHTPGHPIKAADRIVIRRYGLHAVSQVREYLVREWPDHTIRG